MPGRGATCSGSGLCAALGTTAQGRGVVVRPVKEPHAAGLEILGICVNSSPIRGRVSGCGFATPGLGFSGGGGRWRGR